LRAQTGWHSRLLGLHWVPRNQPARRYLRLRQRGIRPRVWRAGGRQSLVLGYQWLRWLFAAGRSVRCRRRWQHAHLRHHGLRGRCLLGAQRRWRRPPTERHLHCYQFRLLSLVRHTNRQDHCVLGRQQLRPSHAANAVARKLPRGLHGLFADEADRGGRGVLSKAVQSRAARGGPAAEIEADHLWGRHTPGDKGRGSRCYV